MHIEVNAQVEPGESIQFESVYCGGTQINTFKNKMLPLGCRVVHVIIIAIQLSIIIYNLYKKRAK